MNIIHSAHFNPIKFECAIHQISEHLPAKGNVIKYAFILFNMHLCTQKTHGCRMCMRWLELVYKDDHMCTIQK